MQTADIAYTATALSISGRFLFLYLLYTKRSTNPYSLLFSVCNVASSSLWMVYSTRKEDMPLLVRSSSDLVLFSVSTAYIVSNIVQLHRRPTIIVEG